MVATLTEIATALIEAEVPSSATCWWAWPMAACRWTSPPATTGHVQRRAASAQPGAAADFAVIMKPWNWVYHEEPGMGWFKLRARHPGLRRRAP
jgi:hypothetical protein